MKQQSKQPQDQDSFLQRYAQVKWGMQFPALTVAVLLRRDIGFRLLHPAKLIAVNGALAVVAILAQPDFEEARPLALLLVAAVSFCAGIGQRLRRWRELSQPAHRHSEYVGTSPMDFAWLPPFMRRNRRMARFADSLLCVLIGLVVFPLSSALGSYLAFSGLCLRVYESEIFERERNRDLDLSDGLVMAQYQSELVERCEDAPAVRSQQSRPGLPTGLGSDIQANIQRQQASKKANRA